MSVSNVNCKLSTRHSQKGVSIVEALVALVVLSVGMLGIAGLYLESLRSNRTAFARTSAVQLVNDMADRIRANRSGLVNYTLVAGTPPTAVTDCSAAVIACTPQQLANWDKLQWYNAVVATLPNGADGTFAPQTAITFNPAAGVTPARYVISTTWREAGFAEDLSTSVEVMLLGST